MFVTYLGTDSFLPGILALNSSLVKYNKTYELIVLVSDSVSVTITNMLDFKKITYKIVKQITNPQKTNDDQRNFKYTYTKLRIFELFEYDKVVYLDADMLVCNNIEELFNRPHLSAVIAGGLHSLNSAWCELNSGLLVIKPDKTSFDDLYSLIGHLPSKDGSDQGFLHSAYKFWPANKSLHLDHKFNVPAGYIDEYCNLHRYKFSYRRRSLNTNIAVIHYWGRYKPWDIDIKQFNRATAAKLEQSIFLWWDIFSEAAKDIGY